MVSNLESCEQQIRVFNKDFIQDNLSFITDPEDGIKSFSVGLGAENKKIMEEIQELENKLGEKDKDNSTGFYLEFKEASNNYLSKGEEIKQDDKELKKLLSNKATARQTGIKYNANRFGDQNYNISKLSADINTVLSSEYIKPNKQKKDKLNQIIKEEKKNFISNFNPCNFTLFSIYERAKKVVAKEISVSDKIQELLNDIALSEWVKQGYELHKTKKNVCSLCGNIIKDERWEVLDKHFSQETQILEGDIENLINEINKHKGEISVGLDIDKNSFYVNYEDEFDKISILYNEEIKKYISLLDQIHIQLEKRYSNITKPFELNKIKVNLPELDEIVKRCKELIKSSNKYTDNISKVQLQAKTDLRWIEVFEFTELIDYKKRKDNIDSKKEKLEEEQLSLEVKWNNIKKIEAQIVNLRRKLIREEQGALKVNEYLQSYFENTHLSLHANEVEGEDENYVEFEIWRKEGKAYHLSEGEGSLIAFCYFMAKLYDTDTEGTKPIIWIDDPISSLDSNHIFCVYSIITSELFEKERFEQIFISTHNLDFLRYLKKTNGKFLNLRQEQGLEKQYFIIQRVDDKSFIQVMPNYMKEYVTEFNYLFHQIYQCANIEVVDDSNFMLFYNFCNNARKFLELYLFYKYPNFEKDRVKMERFFGQGKVPVMLVERVNNEYSHMKACFERGQTTIDVPEMPEVAKLIIKKLKEDKEQFRAFVESIGEEAS